MIVLIEIAFAIWMLSALCSALLGCGILLLAIAAHLVSFTLTGVGVLVEMYWRLWKTALRDGAAYPSSIFDGGSDLRGSAVIARPFRPRPLPC